MKQSSQRRHWLRRVCAALAAANGRTRALIKVSTAPATSLLLVDSVAAETTANHYPTVTTGAALNFPLDHGAHPAFRTEWWYLTCQVTTPAGELGVQITFFRSRTRHSDDNPSRFAPKQLLFAHAAIAKPEAGKLIHSEIAARADDNQFSTQDTALQMRSSAGNWSLKRQADDTYTAIAHDSAFSIELQLRPTTEPVLQGDRGYSRKGPNPEQASYYYSRPQLDVSGKIHIGGDAHDIVTGKGWLDHEWSSEILDDSASGWDWVGLNFDNGDALMAFRIRRESGGDLFSHAQWIRAGKTQPTPAPVFTVEKTWRSPRTGAVYPVQIEIRVADRRLSLRPLLNDQELDTRRSTGTVYWEGAVRVIDIGTGQLVGRGYLELTGYAGKIRF